jgi:hypothetical protein
MYCKGNGREYYMYNKPFNKKYIFYQISDIVKLSDIIIFFQSPETTTLKEYYEKAISKKENKKLILL